MTASEKLYAFDLCKAYPLPEGRLLIRNPRNGRHAVLTPDVYGALLQCRRFHTLADHAAQVVADNPALQGQEAAVLDILRSVQKDGLMLSADIYTVTLQPAADPRYNVDKPVAAVITWERPEALERCLASLRENCDCSQLARIVIIDDSRSEAARTRNRAITQALEEHVETPVLHFGGEEQQGFLEAIIRQVPSIEQQVRFLIDGERWADHWTSGRARTLALLLSVGQRLLVLDDDILCEPWEPAQTDSVSFGDDARETRFYADRGQRSLTQATEAGDPLQRHLRTLGSRLADALGALGTAQLTAGAFEGADLETLERLRADSPVLVTECGTVGDPGTSNLNWLASLDGKSLEALSSNETAVDAAFDRADCWQGMRGARVLPRSNMSQLTGLDNRAMLPPYLPILRGEDRLFGDMLEFLHPAAVVIDQPWAIAHHPIPERQWTAEEQQFQVDQPFERLGLRWLERQDRSTMNKDPLKRLARLARVLEDFTELDDEAMRGEYEDFAIGERAADYRMVLATLQNTGEDAPERWRAFLTSATERLNRALVDNPPDARLTGYPAGLDNEALFAWWRSFWTDFAR